MLTWRELKRITKIPGREAKVPSAAELKDGGAVIAERRLADGAVICAYRNGYAVYRTDGKPTVFGIHSCGDYLYESGYGTVRIPERFFDGEAWYVRLVPEGEDRLARNGEARERRHAVSYSAVSEEWGAMADNGESALERMISMENVRELCRFLTGRQRAAVLMCIAGEMTAERAAAELGVSRQAVSSALTKAVRSMRKRAEEPEKTGGRGE